MRDVFAVLRRLAPTDLPLTLIGETGCGKTRLARAVHAASGRAQARLSVLDFGASGSSTEARLLGIERSMTVGAISDQPGAFEEAQGGSLLVDDAGELTPELQSLLVRVLESRRVRRVGSARDIAVDVRVIAASSRELSSEATAGRLRQDLYFRLTASVVRIPPLRERREDIPLLVAELLADLGNAHVEVTADALALLQAREWFGNVRELKNVLACTIALLDGPRLELRDLERLGLRTEASPLDQMALAGISLEQLERTAIKQTLARVRGNKVRAAKLLGIAVSTLYEKLKRFSID
ncbi:MAG TPA: sigma 54-interacting transcriptional regulator [Polyangiales bacterium]|nr:sigma 54-interacting transcriptional regulator [Polyangiales bacterium]